MIMISQGQQSPRRKASAAGFSLIELTVAMAVFLVVSITSFTLFSRHQTMLGQEQGVAGLNIGLRNALAQIQTDVVNAGIGQIQAANNGMWPVGVTIINQNPATPCNTETSTNPITYEYGPTCFDTLNVVVVDTSTPPIQPLSTYACSPATSEYNTASGTTLVAAVPSGYTAAQVAADFHTGDQILFLKGTPSGTMNQFSTAVLTANGGTTGGIQLSFNATLSTGANNAGANDPISLTVNAPSTEVTNLFCSSDWILRLIPIQYSVDATTNPADPALVRTQPPQSGAKNIVMDQVIGFKVGAATWNGATSSFDYCYYSGEYCDPPPAPYSNTIVGYNNDFTLVRSVRLTIIGRTKPSTDPNYPYRNPFDNGAYQIRGSSIIVDPRNLTMNND